MSVSADMLRAAADVLERAERDNNALRRQLQIACAEVEALEAARAPRSSARELRDAYRRGFEHAPEMHARGEFGELMRSVEDEA